METSPSDNRSLDDLSDLPPIPQCFQSNKGQLVKTQSDVWTLNPSRRGGMKTPINWKLLEGPEKLCVFSQRSCHLVKLYFIDCLARKEASTARHEFGILISFHCWLASQVTSSSSSFRPYLFDWINLSEETIRSFLHFREKQVAGPDYDLSFLRNLYTWGVARRYPDFSPNILRVLKTMKVRTFPKGHNVRFRHPTKGPFSPDEILSIRDAIKEGRGTDQDRSLVMLHLELGVNPYATAQLMNKDLKRYNIGDSIYYQIDIPRVKKRIAHRETKRRPISNQLGELLEKLQLGEPEDPLFHWLNQSWALPYITRAMRRFAIDANLKSLTGSPLRVSPRRFRYTLATHMAEEGASKYHIAEILDHIDLQNVNVYVETVSSIAAAVAKATDPALGPVVKRFLGRIADSKEKQVDQGLPNAIIPAMMPHLPFAVLNSGGVGICGRDVRKDGLCRLFPPLSCYRCSHFAALRDGPHKEMLESIETFISEVQGSVDDRILKQLEIIREAIKEFIELLGPTAIDDTDTPKENA
jgi:integrase